MVRLRGTAGRQGQDSSQRCPALWDLGDQVVRRTLKGIQLYSRSQTVFFWLRPDPPAFSEQLGRLAADSLAKWMGS